MATTPERAGKWRNRGKLLAGIGLGIGVAALSLAVTVDQVFGDGAPDLAARWGTNAAETDAARANLLAQPRATPAALAEAQQLADRALSRDPTNVLAVRALAQVAGLRDDLRGADRLFRYSEQLSRRDLLTQIWLVEERVRHADVSGALTHYDRALRTDTSARRVLFPVLVGANATPEVNRATAALIARHVAWGPDFLSVMAETPGASVEALGRLVLAAKLRLGVPAEREALGAVLRRLVASARYDDAHAAWTGAVGAAGSALLVRDGGFETEPVLPPFDWSFTDETDLSATREPAGKGMALTLRGVNGAAGEFARQLLLLRPGSYRLSLTNSGAGADPIARAAVVVQCASGGREMMRLPLSARDPVRLGTTFTVPPGCVAQALTIVAPAGLGDGSDGVLVDDLTIVPARG